MRLIIRVYIEFKKKGDPVSSIDERMSILSQIIEEKSHKSIGKARKIKSRSHRSYTTYLKELKYQLYTEVKPFIVADTETIMIENVHKPYAVGLLKIDPNKKIKYQMIETYFSEDYSLFISSFEDRSTKMLYDFIKRIDAIVSKEQSIRTIYFHNFSRFDGILLLKHLACHHKNYKLKPLLRNNMLYELVVSSGKKMLFRFRDSLTLLPGKLMTLAKNC